jgi:hypothetical protein
MSDPSARRNLRRLSSSDPPELPRAEALLAAPLPLSKGLGAMAGLALGSHTDGLGTPSQCTRDPDPAEGVLAADLANRHAAVIEGRQHGQDRRPEAWVITERRDVLEEYQGFRDKGLTSNPPIRSSSSTQDRSVPGCRGP